MPSTLSASTFSNVCETIVPSTTGSVSRVRPRRRATTRAREGSPRRAGSVDDISTPMNVPCIASRRFALRQVGAAARIACQLSARANIAAHISARPAATRPGLEARSDAATRVTPTCSRASAARPTPASELAARPARRSVRSRRAEALIGCFGARRLQARQALGGLGHQQIARGQPVAPRGAHQRPAAVLRPLRRRDRLLVAVERFGGDVRPREALRTLACRARHPLASRDVERHRAQALGERERVPRRRQHPVLAVADDVAVARDVGGDHRRGGGERLGQHHAEALAVQRRGAQHVGFAQPPELLLLGDLAEGLDAGLLERHVRDLVAARTDQGQRRRHVFAQRLERRQEHRQALALHGLADEQDAQLAAAPRTSAPAAAAGARRWG